MGDRPTTVLYRRGAKASPPRLPQSRIFAFIAGGRPAGLSAASATASGSTRGVRPAILARGWLRKASHESGLKKRFINAEFEKQLERIALVSGRRVVGGGGSALKG